MLRNIYLHGALGVEFGKTHRLAVESVGEAIDALRANFPRFVPAIRDGFYRIVLGKSKSGGLTLREDQLFLNLGNRDVHIVPTAAGRKRGGLSKVIAGIALVGLSAATGGAGGVLSGSVLGTSGAQMAGQMGVGMVLTGVANMISPEIRAGDETKSFTMSGPTSDLREGMIVPIVYGEVITGGYAISGAIEINGPAASGNTSTIRNLANSAGGSASRIEPDGGFDA